MKRGYALKNYYLLTFFSPVLGVYFATRSLPWKFRKSILILAITLFGSTIILKTSDGYVLQQMIYDHYVGLSFEQWLFELKELLVFSPETGTKGDVFSHVFSYLVGHVLDLPGQYFVLVSFIFAYLYVRALALVLDDTRGHVGSKNLLVWAFIILFIAYTSVDQIQFVRTSTGTWMLFNGVYSFHQTGNKKYLWLMLAAPLFHVAYFVIALPAYAVILLRKLDPRFFIIAYIASFFININPSAVIQQLETTDVGQEKVKGYYREDPSEYIDLTQIESYNWYVRYGKHWSAKEAPHLLALALILLGCFNKKKMNGLEIGLFSTGLLMATMANLGDFVPAFYNRTMGNAGLFIIVTATIMLLNGNLMKSPRISLAWKKILMWSVFLTFIPYLVYIASNILQFTSVFMLAMPVAGFFPDLKMSLRDFLGYFWL